MSTPASRAPNLTVKFVSQAWWILLVAALTLLWVETNRRIERVDTISNLPTFSVATPQRDSTSATGFENGQRKLIIPNHHSPSFAWIMEAQQTVEEGKLRLRHITYDAAPQAREIRRTAPYRWWLITVGWLHGTMSNQPLGYAIERGTLVADPILLALLLIGGAIYSARYIGNFAAIGFVVGGISIFPLAANFQPGAPDPHSLAWILALGSVLPLLVSARKVTKRRQVHYAIAGAFGGLGLWNDATSQAPVLLAIFLGALCCEYIRSRGTIESSPAPSHWRVWALAGTLTTLGASAFEFAPNYFSWSLDSINPIHAVAWWGLGEALHATGIWSKSGRMGFHRSSLVVLIVAIIAITSWPVTGILSDSGSLLASDFYAREIANHPSGGIAPNLKAWLSRASGETKMATLLPCSLFFVLLTRICLGKPEPEERGRLVFISVAALLAMILAYYQLRWWNLFNVFALTALTTLLAETETGPRFQLKPLWITLLVLPGLFVGFPPAVKGKEVDDLTTLESQGLIARDFAYWLNKRGGDGPNVLFSTPIFSSAVAFYGGFNVIVSSDDDNELGFLTAVRISSASTGQEAGILLNSRQITHLALPLWDPMLDQLVRIGTRVPFGQPLPQNSFSVSLRQWDFPLWLRAMNYPISNKPEMQGFAVTAFAVQAEQEPDLGMSRLADLFVERGQMREAKSIRETLKTYPRSVVAIGAIANIDYAFRDRTNLDASLESLIPYLSRRSSRNLPVDRRLSIAIILFRTNHVDLARDQVTASMEQIDAETLRTLTPTSIAGLLALSQSLGIPFPDEDLKNFAMELIPPDLREGLSKK